MTKANKPAPMRLYNLFPPLVADLTEAAAGFPRIAAMGFDWVYLNPVHKTGGSRSLYAIASYDEIDPRFAGAKPVTMDTSIAALASGARKAGLKLMFDLVLNHTSDNHPFTTEKPHWYARDKAGEILHPSAIDPAGGPGQVWGDLAELDFHGTGKGEITAYFTGYVKRLVKLGVQGFRCDAAYKVPAEIWAALIKAARDTDAGVVFAAETLGCRLDEIEALSGVGFDYLFNSSKWWNLDSAWAVTQYNQFRQIAPSIAFPESHDTPRLAADLAALDPTARARFALFRYALAANFSTGVMMPMGYEFGIAKPLSVTDSVPADMAERVYDISDGIAAINAAKLVFPALAAEGRMEFRRLSGGAGAFARFDTTDRDVSLFVANPAQAGSRWVERQELCDWLGIAADDLLDVTPGRNEAPEASRFELVPGGYAMFETVLAARAPISETPEAMPCEPNAGWSPESRIVIEGIYPEIDGGRFPAKRVAGDRLTIEADIFVDGHDKIAAEIVWRQGRHKGRSKLRLEDNDRWRGDVMLTHMGRLHFTIEAWIDAFESWRWDTTRKHDAGQPIPLELNEGRALLANAARNGTMVGRKAIEAIVKAIDAATDDDHKAAILFSAETRRYMGRLGQRDYLTRSPREIEVTVDRERAANAAWYGMFQRSQGSDPSRGATFAECEARLPEIADMGFDVVYLVPIHPIGMKHRKGRDNSVTAEPGEPGSPYAIGGPMGNGPGGIPRMGGHTDIHPDLGTLADFRHFVTATRAHGMEVALDFAIQCSMDHPWIVEHPEWFFWREDGTIKYAENPPKKYQDIVNVNFHGPHWKELWEALRDVVLFWVEQGVDIFRVDNPHTKPLAFWEWMIREVQSAHPQVIFLAEAFTRPKMMRELGKAGFTQSYTYFTWRNTKQELTEYVTELATTGMREYYRGNFFTCTPDILPAFLQSGKLSAFKIRAALAAMLSGLYGIYNGFELCEAEAVPGKEEYLHSEKYQYKTWDWDRPGNIKEYLKQLNHIRRSHPQMQRSEGVRFHHIDDGRVLLFSRSRNDAPGAVFVAVMLDPDGYFQTDITLPLEEAGYRPTGEFNITEPLHQREYPSDHGAVHIDLWPDMPAQVFVVD